MNSSAAAYGWRLRMNSSAVTVCSKNDSFSPLVFLVSQEKKTLPVGLMQLMQAQQAAAQYGMMYAGLVMVMLPTLILYMCVQKQLTEGMTVGGLKG